MFSKRSFRTCIYEAAHLSWERQRERERTSTWPHNLFMEPECRMKQLCASHHLAADFRWLWSDPSFRQGDFFFFFFPRPPLYSARLCFIVRGLEGTMHQTVVQHKHLDTAHWFFFFFWDALSAVSACFCLRRFFTVTKWPTQWAASGPEPLMFQTVTAAAEVRLHHQKSLVFFAIMSKCVSLLFVLLRFCPSATLGVGA